MPEPVKTGAPGASRVRCVRQAAPLVQVLAAETPPAAGDGYPATQQIQLLPLGLVRTVDGREFAVTDRSVAEVMRRWDERTNDLVVDYQHATIRAAVGDAPAAGWITALEWHLPGDGAAPETAVHGLWATVEWTSPARERLAAREYRYVSAVLDLEFPEIQETPGGIWVPTGPGVVVQLLMASLVNDPAIDGMAPVVASAFHHPAPLGARPGAVAGARKENHMDELLKLLGFATAEEAQTALADLRQKAGKVEALSADLTAAQSRVTELESKLKTQEVEHAIGLARQAGRVTTENEAFARELATTSMPLFVQWRDKEAPAAAPEGRLKLSRMADPPADEDDRDALHARVQAYAAERKCSYGVAYDAVAGKGK